MRGVRGFVNQISCGESGICIAALEADLVGDVAPARMNAGRFFIQGFLGRQDGGQFFVLDLDQVQRIAGDLFCGGSHGCHLFPRKAHQAVGQNAPLLVAHAPGRARCICPGQHGFHTGQRTRCSNVDAHDARMRIGAAQQLGMQHARQLEVARVLGTT